MMKKKLRLFLDLLVMAHGWMCAKTLTSAQSLRLSLPETKWVDGLQLIHVLLWFCGQIFAWRLLLSFLIRPRARGMWLWDGRCIGSGESCMSTSPQGFSLGDPEIADTPTFFLSRSLRVC